MYSSRVVCHSICKACEQGNVAVFKIGIDTMQIGLFRSLWYNPYCYGRVILEGSARRPGLKPKGGTLLRVGLAMVQDQRGIEVVTIFFLGCTPAKVWFA